MRILPAITIILLSSVGAVYQAVIFERVAPVPRDGDGNELIFLPSASQAKMMSLGYDQVVADYYWVKGLQYFTSPHDVTHYKNLGDYLEVVLGLDPDYRYAYKFAGLSIPYDSGGFRFRNTKRSTAFLERGVIRFPEWWELHFLLGYNYLNFHNEPIKAAEQFRLAAALPGAPVYLNAFATRVLAVGGQIDRAIAVTEEILRSTEAEEVRELMTRRLADLLLEKELRRIEDAAQAFKQTAGRFPSGIDELVAAGLSPRPDPRFTLSDDGVAHFPDAERMKLHSTRAQAGFGAID